MEFLDFNGCELSSRAYGGMSGAKVGIIYHGEYYLLKFPKRKSSGGYKNVELSYSNNPTCEYMGSHIYKMLGFPVHKTLLGTRNGKTVVACKDFRQRENEFLDLLEFREIKTTMEPPLMDEHGDETDGNGTKLSEVLRVIDEHPLLKRHPETKKRFWDMFIVDAFIGNADRNNGNWGLLVSFDNHEELAPIYDNGACLNSKWDDAKMQRFMIDTSLFRAQAYNGVICVYRKDNGKSINPFQYLKNTENKDCRDEMKWLIPKIHSTRLEIQSFIENFPSLSETQKTFYKRILERRIQHAFLPIYEQQFQKGKSLGR